jgi:hypothetical protein
MKMKKHRTLITASVSIIVIALNFPGIGDDCLHPIQTAAATIVLLCLLTAFHAFAERSAKHVKKEPAVPENPSTEQPHEPLPPFDAGQDIAAFLNTMLKAYTSSDCPPSKEESDRLLTELDIYRQCYLWCQQMQKRYGKDWQETFQGSSLPLQPKDIAHMRSLMAEVALHTVDFCRYRTADVNLTERMRVNPRMILLDADLKAAGAQPVTDNPYEMPKEVLALNELFRQDQVQLTRATIHGFYDDKH